MRKRLKNFLPIVLIALMVQIFAPIAACWAASIVASDPLAAAVICHGSPNAAPGQSDPNGNRAHHGCCSVCNVLHTGAPVDVPQTAEAVAFVRQQTSVAWVTFTPQRFGSRAGSHAQARAPPSIS